MRISVVTVCYNAENFIEKTLKSVITQNYEDLELIVIDGKSTDKTLSIVRKYSDFIDVLISERTKVSTTPLIRVLRWLAVK